MSGELHDLAALPHAKDTTQPLNSSQSEHQCNNYMKAYTIQIFFCLLLLRIICGICKAADQNEKFTKTLFLISMIMKFDDAAVWQADISEKHAVSMFSISALKTETAHSPDMLVLIRQNTWCHVSF
jgi:hypothetical protein